MQKFKLHNRSILQAVVESILLPYHS